MPIMSKLVAAYIAGLIDGDGYLGIVKEKKETYKNGIMYYAVIKVGMCDKNIIQWLYQSFGGSFYEREFKNNRRNHYTWTIKNGNVKPILEKILPYLRVKRKQGETIKLFLKTFYQENYTIKKNGEHSRGVHRELNNSVSKEREELYSKIKELNHIGKSWQFERLNEVSLV